MRPSARRPRRACPPPPPVTHPGPPRRYRPHRLAGIAGRLSGACSEGAGGAFPRPAAKVTLREVSGDLRGRAPPPGAFPPAPLRLLPPFINTPINRKGKRSSHRQRGVGARLKTTIMQCLCISINSELNWRWSRLKCLGSCVCLSCSAWGIKTVAVGGGLLHF